MHTTRPQVQSHDLSLLAQSNERNKYQGPHVSFLTLASLVVPQLVFFSPLHIVFTDLSSDRGHKDSYNQTVSFKAKHLLTAQFYTYGRKNFEAQ